MLIRVLAACRPPDDPKPPPPIEVEAATLETMPTVIEVRWQTEAAEPGHVDFSYEGTERSTPASAAVTEHAATLVGLPPDTDVTVRVPGADPVVVRTGALPDAHVLLVEGDGNDVFATTTILGERSLVVLLDPQGRVTWQYEDPRGLEAFRAMILRDGSGVAYLSSVAAGGPAPDSAIVEVGWDGVVRREILVPDLAHDLVQLPDGTFVALAYETRDDVLGNSLLAVDAGGGATSLWSSWDCYDPVVTPGDDPPQGWTHANALDYDPVEDVFLVGLRNFSTVVAVDRATGTCSWALGGAGGDVQVDGARFFHEHQFDRTDGGLLVFDNDGAAGQVSRVVEYAYDEAAGTANVARILTADPPLFSFILGDVRRLPGGDTMIAWGATGVIDRVAPDDTRTWRADVGEDSLIGFVHWQADPYVWED